MVPRRPAAANCSTRYGASSPGGRVKLGVITQPEHYCSLRELSEAALRALGERYDVLHLRLKPSTPGAAIRTLYRESQVVVSLGSTAPRYERSYDRPTVFLGHAWMDHGAGIIFRVRRHHFSAHDIVTFASTGALRKYREVYPNGIRSRILPYFIEEVRSTPNSGEIASLWGRHGVPDGKRVLIYFGRLSPEKNIVALLEIGTV